MQDVTHHDQVKVMLRSMSFATEWIWSLMYMLAREILFRSNAALSPSSS